MFFKIFFKYKHLKLSKSVLQFINFDRQQSIPYVPKCFNKNVKHYVPDLNGHFGQTATAVAYP